MSTVTQVANKVKQPHGGYLKVKDMRVDKFDDGAVISDNENIHASLIGLAVDYLTRAIKIEDVDKAFAISIRGAINIGELENACRLLDGIRGLDDKSIINACKVVGYDVCYRVGAMGYKPVDEINPNDETINNVRILVVRSLTFLSNSGDNCISGIEFSGGSKENVINGDCDYIIDNKLIDLKVSKKRPTNKHTLQIMLYWRLLEHSDAELEIKELGIFNARLNEYHSIQVSEILKENIEAVDTDVIGY